MNRGSQPTARIPYQWTTDNQQHTNIPRRYDNGQLEMLELWVYR